ILEISLFESEGRQKTRKPMTVVVSAMVHVVTVGMLVLVPLWQTQALTIPPIDMSLLLPHIERPQSIPVFPVGRAVQRTRPAASDAFTAPQQIPQRIATVDEPPTADLPFVPSDGVRGIPTLITSLSS